MEIKYFCPQWGSSQLDFNEFVTNVANAAYDGIEMSLPLNQVEKTSILPESYLHDQQAAIDLAISRTDHIHARVGFPEGPQITDPRDPDWKEAVDIHLGWWKRIVEIHRKEGQKVFTITPEFGPFPYMTTLPLTRQPIANQWEINVYMMNMLKAELISG